MLHSITLSFLLSKICPVPKPKTLDPNRPFPSPSPSLAGAGAGTDGSFAMSSSHHGRVFWRPSELDEVLLPLESPPVLMWTDSTREAGEVVQAHETPMGACLLSPKSVAGWGSRRKVKYVSSSEAAEVPQIGVKAASSGRKAKKRSDAEPDSRAKGSKVDRWSRERYRTAELKLVEIMRAMGAGLGSPVPRQELRAEVRKHIGDTGLLDHLLKHMVGRVVANNAERLRRRHNSEGAMEYWLEPADLAEIRRKSGVIDPYWVPPPGWNLGDAISLCPFGGTYCKKETSRLREEVALMKRDYQRLLQWRSKIEEEIEGQVVEGHETRLEASLLSPLFAELSGWGTRRKVMYNRRHREMPSALVPKAAAGWEQRFGDKRLRERKDEYHKLRHGKEAEKKRRKEKDDDDQESRVMGSKVDRWSLERYEAAELKLVEIMHDLGANMGSPILRQMLREKMRKHIGDTGLLDHLLKHMVGKIVADGTERLQRRHNAEGAMEYWLEPANFVEIRQKAGVLDPCWVPPPGWKLGDSTLPCPCSAECKKEMNWLRKEVTILKREVERLKALVQLGNQAKEAEAEAGGLPELAELEEQVGREDSWYVRLFSGTEGRDVVDERRGQEAQVWRIL